jgi:predicted RNA methylase
MDFVVQNKETKKYLCVIEVKRTPSDVNSVRYQYQAMSYVQNVRDYEKPYYVLTNLEYAFAFRYDVLRPRVFQQMLEPGLIHIGDFALYSEVDFEKRLIKIFSELIKDFINDERSYLVTFEQFESHMMNITQNAAKWKSSLVVLLYEYIRGAFLSIGRQDLPYDVRAFQNNIERICEEAVKVNFKEIFTYSTRHEKTVSIEKNMLSSIFSLGKQHISGDSIAGLLHSIVTKDLDHDGVVPTDLELARLVAMLAKSISGRIEATEYICDPAAGSGNLISSAVPVYNISINQIKANDVDERLLELLSLRIGLNFAKTVNSYNTAEISAKNIVDLPSGYFDNVRVIVMNPPFVAGINCIERKQLLFNKIREIKRKNAVTNVGQMNLEGAFLETVCSLCKQDTVIACVLPKAHLVARGKEAVTMRKYLLSNFGLQIIFSYPEEGLFESVVKSTCVVVGRIGALANEIKIISSICTVADIDLIEFEKSIDDGFNNELFVSIMPGVEGLSQTKEQLLSIVQNGWRIACREYKDTQLFIDAHIKTNKILMQMSAIEKRLLRRARGSAGNSGASELLQVKKSKPLYQSYKNLPTIPSLRNAVLDELLITAGDTVCFEATRISDDDLLGIATDYLRTPVRESRQQRKEKNQNELVALLKRTASKLIPENSVLIPRTIRVRGRIYITTKKTAVSTNFYALYMQSMDEALILASWFSTIFYQLICEANAKPQEGPRKMEVMDIETTYIPVLANLSLEQKTRIITEAQNLKFLILNKPEIRKTDKIWAEILFCNDADKRLSEAKRLLAFFANARNPLAQ